MNFFKSFWDKLFSRVETEVAPPPAAPPTPESTAPAPQKSLENLATAPLSQAQLATAELTEPIGGILPPAPSPILRIEPPQFIAACGQSVGKQRDQNQDTLFALSTVLASSGTPQPFGIYIVADGMGGHQHGEIASETAARAMTEYLMRQLYLPYVSIDHKMPDRSIQEILQEGVYQANRLVMDAVPDGGTTLTAAVLLGRQMTIAHVGDSRAYLIHPNGRMTPLTRDHSLVRRLEEMGQITPAEAAIHPQRNVLYRALGQGEPIEPEIAVHRLPSVGHIMICSDGLWNVVPEMEISRIITQNMDTYEASQYLVNAANDAGGPDNISVILIRLPEY